MCSWKFSRHFLRGEERINRQLVDVANHLSIAAGGDERCAVTQNRTAGKSLMFSPVFASTLTWMLLGNCSLKTASGI